MPGRLSDKVAIITGGGTGIGEAICHKFAREGAKVVVSGLPSDPVDDVVQKLTAEGLMAVAFKGDISEPAAAEACVRTAVDLWGKLDILVNNAGVFLTNAEIDKFPIEDFDLHLKMNLRSAFMMTRFAIPHLQKSQGCIVSAGSEAGFNGIAQNAPYGGTKGFMHAFIKGVAIEQAKYGVRANCVAPGPIDTAWTHADSGPMDSKLEKMTVESTAFGRRGTPEEMANVYCFLASEEASFVTGAIWLADAGQTPAKGPVGKEASAGVKQQPAGEISSHLEHSHDGLKNKEYHEVR